MYFEARIRKDGPGYRVTFPGLPNVITFAESRPNAVRYAEEALIGCLLEDMDRGFDLPVPTQSRTRRGTVLIPVPVTIAVALLLRKHRRQKRWTTVHVAQRLGITRQAYEKLERGKGNPSLQTLRKAFAVFGQMLGVVTYEAKAA